MVKNAVKNLTTYQPEMNIDKLKQSLGVDKIVRLSANESPYGSSPDVKKELLNNGVADFNRYPDSEPVNLKSAVTNELSLSPEQLIFGNGSDELISLICQTFLNPGDQVISPNPTFGEYQISSQINGATTKKVSITDDGQIDLNGILSSIDSKTKLIWLCNPNNPTGRYIKKAVIIDFVNQLPNDITVVVDEAYIDFVTEEANASITDVVNNFNNVIVLRTLSKAYGLANLRIGYAVSNPNIIQNLQKLRAPYNVNSISDIAGAAAVKDQNFLKKVIKENRIEVKKWEAFFKSMNWSFFPSQTNFIFFKVPQTDELYQFLKKKGYLLRFGLGQNWLRISMGTTDENNKVRNLIKQFINNNVIYQ